MLAVLSKVALLVLAALFLNLGTTAPQPPPTDKDKVYSVGPFERAVRVWIYLIRAFWTGLTLCPAVVLLTRFSDHAYAPSVVSALCPRPTSFDALASITPTFLLTFALVIGGALLRLWCYRTLGRFFTFEVTLKNEHRLVTNGPYAVVRHPSYTAAYAVCAGTMGMLYAKGGYIHECGLMATPARWAVYACFALNLFISLAVINRVPVEDALLRESFGEEWERWHKRVPYALIPGIY